MQIFIRELNLCFLCFALYIRSFYKVHNNDACSIYIRAVIMNRLYKFRSHFRFYRAPHPPVRLTKIFQNSQVNASVYISSQNTSSQFLPQCTVQPISSSFSGTSPNILLHINLWEMSRGTGNVATHLVECREIKVVDNI